MGDGRLISPLLTRLAITGEALAPTVPFIPATRHALITVVRVLFAEHIHLYVVISWRLMIFFTLFTVFTVANGNGPIGLQLRCRQQVGHEGGVDLFPR